MPQSPYVQFRFESVAGNEHNTPTLSAKTAYLPLNDCEFDLGPEWLRRDDELRGRGFDPATGLTEIFNPTLSAKIRLYPDSAAIFRTWCHGLPVTTEGDGVITDLDGNVVPAGVQRHRWEEQPDGLPLTMQIIVAVPGSNVFWRIKGAFVKNEEIDNAAEGGVVVSLSVEALYAERIENPNLTPAYESFAIRPFTRAGLSLPENLTNGAATTEFSLSTSFPVERVRTLAAASKFADIVDYEETGGVKTTGSIEKRDIDPQDIDALINASTFRLRADWESESEAADGTPFRMGARMDTVQYAGGGTTTAKQARRQATSFEWEAATDDVTPSVVWEVINTTESYA